MLQGNIRAKQLHLSGHRYVHIFDLAAGFYVCTIAEESQPYLSIYIEGFGYLAYCCMPFGITGGPSEFAHLTADKLHDLMASSIVEIGRELQTVPNGICSPQILPG